VFLRRARLRWERLRQWQVPVGPLERDAIAAYGVDGTLVHELASFSGAVRARGKFFPVDLDASGVDDAASGGGNFGPMPSPAINVTLCSMLIVLYAKVLTLVESCNAGVASKKPHRYV